MDKHLILEFANINDAIDCLEAINDMAAQYWAANGYTVEQGDAGKELIGKLRGRDNIEAARTTTWDLVEMSPDDTFYFASLSNDPRFAAGMDQLAGVFNFIEKEIPINWGISSI